VEKWLLEGVLEARDLLDTRMQQLYNRLLLETLAVADV
jgi:hypothetical protein